MGEVTTDGGSGRGGERCGRAGRAGRKGLRDSGKDSDSGSLICGFFVEVRGETGIPYFES